MTSTIGVYREADAELVARTREGDVSAFETIVERYRAVLIARANAKLGSLTDAEDVAQDAFVQAYFHLNELRDPEALLPWLRKMTERLALMRVRSRRENPVDPYDLDMIAGSHSGKPTDAVNVEYILSLLPEAMRETVSLTFLVGYTCAEAAVIMGVQEGTVKSRLNRARAKLKEVMGMAEQDIVGGQPTGEFTRRTIERLKDEMRRLAAEGKFQKASEKAGQVIAEQIKPLFGDPEKLGFAKTLAAYDSGSFKPDAEAVSMLGLPHMERRRIECEANAAQYGFKLDDLDWELANVDTMSGTLGRSTGCGKDIWGVPMSRMELEIIDTRALCQRLRVSPLILYEWVQNGCPILRCWPFARFDVERVQQWLVKNEIADWPAEDAYLLERPIRLIFKAVYDGQLPSEDAEAVMETLGYGIWEAPMPVLKGGW